MEKLQYIATLMPISDISRQSARGQHVQDIPPDHNAKDVPSYHINDRSSMKAGLRTSEDANYVEGEASKGIDQPNAGCCRSAGMLSWGGVSASWMLDAVSLLD